MNHTVVHWSSQGNIQKEDPKSKSMGFCRQFRMQMNEQNNPYSRLGILFPRVSFAWSKKKLPKNKPVIQKVEQPSIPAPNDSNETLVRNK